MSAQRVLPGLLQKARLDAMRFRITPRKIGGFTIWFEFENFGWRVIGHTPHLATAIEFAAAECAKLAEGPR